MEEGEARSTDGGGLLPASPVRLSVTTSSSISNSSPAGGNTSVKTDRREESHKAQEKEPVRGRTVGVGILSHLKIWYKFAQD